ncbi:hypothetical protein [Aureimonas sp. Leaf324]|jgi:hypothetical protein|uniref:hypothetical protein n=1 Tax=Aureimonas sp. Leaf324 TaxID=1736336 RepID=UPI0006FFC06E|nr:hypothetical protein [Aureimonas sp. Leaf324]KQQ80559.1 hypothetical protein ASF65_10015 [Aureimonas sp. Leaf324]
MVKDRRFRSVTLARVERVEPHEDGTIAVFGLTGSGDAVALTVQPAAIRDLLIGLQSAALPVD